MSLFIAVVIAMATLCIIEGVFLVVRNRWNPETRRVEKQLRELSRVSEADISLLTPLRPLSQVSWLNRFLLRIPAAVKLDLFLVQAGASYPLGVYLLLSVVLALVGFLFLRLTTHSFFLSIAGIALGIAPYVMLSLKKSRRIKKFEEQLPEALDLIARSLRAGHALMGGLQMVGQEFGEPAGPEFTKTAAQISLGVSMDQSLKNLTDRVDCRDLKFLAVSIIIQRESGGNLAEILESISRLIRERFKLKGKIRALSAEGKLSAIILTGLPFLVVAALLVTNGAYIRFLVEDPMGRILVLAALLMIAAGIFFIKKMIAIRV
jgi:tight adherence protein B